jgi:opacity protein-like surface antigen
MSRSRIDRIRPAFIALALLALAAPAAAEPPPQRDWDVALFGYGWLIASEASFDTEFGDVDIDASISDNLEDLELAAMGALDVRYRRFVFFLDGVWTQIGDESSVAQGRVDADMTLAYADAKLGFRLLDATAPWADASQLDAPRVVFDLLGGARYWYTRLEADGRFPNVSNRQFDKTKDWVDPLVGARFAIGILPTLNFSVIGDVGGFDIGNGSELTWMVMPTLNWRPWEHWSFHAGYKHVKAERERPRTNRDLDVELTGPMVGVGFHF